jgi:AbrB family looped-hinge helix DNA binding protein
VRITSKGQVTIPQEIREEAGLLPDTEVDFAIVGGVVRIRKARATKRPTRGGAAVKALRGRATAGMTTEEILALTRSR